MNKIIYKSIILLACICCLQSCKKEEIMYYEGGSAVHFLSRTQNHSFLLTLDEQYGEMTIPVMLVGNPVDKDINLSYEIINDEQYTTASSEHYEILEAVIPKGEQRGYVKVRVSNPNLLDLGTPTLTLRLKLVDGNDVQAGGWLDYLTIDLTWSSDVVQPATWGSMRWFTCIQYSSNVYRAYIAATGLLEMYYSLTPAPDGTEWPEQQCYVLGKKFGDWVRQWNKDHYPEVYCHDDGPYAGQPIQPEV